VIDVLVSARRDADAARRFFRRALAVLKVTPSEVVTDAAPVYPAVLDELIPSAWHRVERHANNPIEADHSPAQRPPGPDNATASLRETRSVPTSAAMSSASGCEQVDRLARLPPRAGLIPVAHPVGGYIPSMDVARS
jgi:transposase-like protein